MKIQKEAHVDIIEAFTVYLWTLQMIADVMHVSRQAIKKILNKHGIDTGKRKITVTCTVCGKTNERPRKRAREQRNHFCDTDCYSAFLDAGKSDYVANRQGQRTARRIVGELFDLKPEHVVHHSDRNQLNNMVNNLMVFASQGDHMKHHHRGRDDYQNSIVTPLRTSQEGTYGSWQKVEPIWTGED